MPLRASGRGGVCTLALSFGLCLFKLGLQLGDTIEYSTARNLLLPNGSVALRLRSLDHSPGSFGIAPGSRDSSTPFCECLADCGFCARYGSVCLF